MPILFIIFSLIFSGCDQKPQVRHYAEVTVEPAQPMPMAMTDPHAGLDMATAPAMPTANDIKLLWDTPAGWSQEAGNAMRLVSFHPIDDPKAIDCSIVSLGGMAGGIEANLTRWMKQINLDAADEAFDAFLRSAEVVTTKAGASAAVYDFTKLQEGSDGATQSIIAAVLHLGEATVFVKMTGSIDNINANHSQFLSLVQSIRNP